MTIITLNESIWKAIFALNASSDGRKGQGLDLFYLCQVTGGEVVKNPL